MDLHHRTHLWVRSRECVGCDDCEKACAGRHGVKRLLRSSAAFSVAVPEVCQHCPAPTCVESCISGALTRDPDLGIVRLDRDQCVGCWSCLMACPYMAPRRDERDQPVATKCDRCEQFPAPACVSRCRTGAMRCGDDDALARDLARKDVWTTPLLRAGFCALVPIAAFVLGGHEPAWLSSRYHAAGVAAGALLLLAMALPLLGRALWRWAPQPLWTRAHMSVGVLAAAGAMIHANGRFQFNIQTLAAGALGLLVLSGVCYRYLRPLSLMLAALLRRQAAHLAHEGLCHAPDAPPHVRLCATASAARTTQAWDRAMRNLDAFLEACRIMHIVFAIVAGGLVVAHTLTMILVSGLGSAS